MRNRMMTVLSLGVAGLVCCKSTAPRAGVPTVYYKLVPYTCSSTIPVQFFVDSVQVGADTFRVAVAGGDHVTSGPFATTAGQHAVGARTLGGFVWRDTTVTLSPGAVFVDSLPFYCS